MPECLRRLSATGPHELIQIDYTLGADGKARFEPEFPRVILSPDLVFEVERVRHDLAPMTALVQDPSNRGTIGATYRHAEPE